MGQLTNSGNSAWRRVIYLESRYGHPAGELHQTKQQMTIQCEGWFHLCTADEPAIYCSIVFSVYVESFLVANRSARNCTWMFFYRHTTSKVSHLSCSTCGVQMDAF